MNETGNRRSGNLDDLWAIVDGLPMYARVALDQAPPGAPSVVLVHGLGVSSRYMVPTALRLAPDYRVYAPDLPGFGKSIHPPRALDIAGQADALAAWMAAVGLERAVFLGNSVGCQAIAALAHRHPARLTRAILVGPAFDPAARSALTEIRRVLRDWPHEPLSLDWIVLRDYLAAGPLRIWQTFQFALRYPLAERLAGLAAPTLVVRGGEDPIVPQAWAERATTLLPDGRLVVVPGAGHAVNYDAPAPLVAAVRAFLGSLPCPA
ncbi:MAG TPA: alpha/beta hydrolase [Thermomicrobiaceae bacterium]|nr:alpha/beta hydrolase [Thermomicrobiaceae bacterium]